MRLEQRSYYLLIFAWVALVINESPLSWGFHSTDVKTITMSVTTGGTPPPKFLQMSHQALQGVSLVTKVALIQGTVGTNLQGFNPDLKQFLAERIVKAAEIYPTASPSPVLLESASPQPSPSPTPFSVTSVICVTLRYQSMGVNLNSGTGPLYEQKMYLKDDPAAFVFQVDPSQVKPGVFRYRIIAQKYNNQGVVVASTSFPKDVLSNPNVWASVNVQAAAAPVVGIQGGRVTLPDGNPNDGESAIDVAAGVFKTPTSLTLNEVPVNEAPSVGGFPQPLAVYSLDAQPSFAGSVRISVIYPDFVPAVSNWVFSGTPVQKNQLSLAGWDGFSWRRLGGKVDQNLNTITGLTNDFHYVGVFEMGGASPLDDRPMEKIITPNGDTVNDSARFSSIDPGTKIEIFDINGHRVRTITTDLTHNEWNGQDDSGKIVESGVYIYQYSENGQRVSGVIAVAK